MVVHEKVLRPELVALPGGRFWMGSDNGRADEKPLHEVILSPFELGRHLVTNAEYGAFLQATGWAPPAEWGRPGFSDPQCPVCGVSWVDAVRYCDWLNEQTARAGSRRRYHLPTEAQRQFAACGGVSGLEYPWGDQMPPLEGYYARGLDGPLTGGPMPVGTVPWWPDPPPPEIGPAPGRFGIHNVADNVHEWCADYYSRHYYAESPREEPRGPATGERRSATAGSWRHDIKFARNAARSSLAPTKRFTDFGFRVARSERFEYS